jgi:hypothetical protein
MLLNSRFEFGFGVDERECGLLLAFEPVHGGEGSE